MSYFKAKAAQTYSEYTVNGILYTDVVRIEFWSQIYYHHLSKGPISITDYYYAKDVGLIRRIIDRPSYDDTLDLVNYHIAPH